MCACRGTAGFAHVSCLAEQAKILREEAEENNLGAKAKNERWNRWYTCSLCEQKYYGVVKCALGWVCWKTYVGRPEANWARRSAMSVLGAGLSNAERHEEALSVKEAELAMDGRLGADEGNLLITQGNLANTYQKLGQLEKAMRMSRDVHFGWLRLHGEEHERTLSAGNNYAASLIALKRYAEIKSLLRKMMPVARRVLGESDQLALKMRFGYARALYKDKGATLDDLREAVTTLEDTERTARRVLGGAHPTTTGIEAELRRARADLCARETPPTSKSQN